MASRSYDHTLLILIAAIFLFISPLTSWWSSLELPWFAIFIPWAAIVALIGLNQHRLGRNDD